MKYQNIELHNVSDIVTDNEAKGFTITRLPSAILPEINEGARWMSRLSGNVELRGMLPKGGKARVVLQMLDDNCVPPIVNVFFGDFRYKQILLKYEATEIVIDEPEKMELMEKIYAEQEMRYDPRLVRVCLPHIHYVRILEIEGDLTYPEEQALPRKTLLCYGSSITHGAHAIAPESTYAAQCAYNVGYDLINLGSGGSARMDTAVAHHIASRNDWDVATLEMGVNVRDWEPDTFREAVERFVGIIVAAHPDKPVFCIDLFTNGFDCIDPPREAVGFREIVKGVVEKQDSPNVFYVDGRTILTRFSGLQVDLVHPNDNGMVEMGRNLAHTILQNLR